MTKKDRRSDDLLQEDAFNLYRAAISALPSRLVHNASNCRHPALPPPAVRVETMSFSGQRPSITSNSMDSWGVFV